jgi:hypothetical protein
MNELVAGGRMAPVSLKCTVIVALFAAASRFPLFHNFSLFSDERTIKPAAIAVVLDARACPTSLSNLVAGNVDILAGAAAAAEIYVLTSVRPYPPPNLNSGVITVLADWSYKRYLGERQDEDSFDYLSLYIFQPDGVYVRSRNWCNLLPII